MTISPINTGVLKDSYKLTFHRQHSPTIGVNK